MLLNLIRIRLTAPQAVVLNVSIPIPLELNSAVRVRQENMTEAATGVCVRQNHLISATYIMTLAPAISLWNWNWIIWSSQVTPIIRYIS